MSPIVWSGAGGQHDEPDVAVPGDVDQVRSAFVRRA